MQFEATKFETRTMPTPNMKGKEMIYWIRVETKEKRLATELEHFLRTAPQRLDLRVPSAFISVMVELESYRPAVPEDSDNKSDEGQKAMPLEQADKEGSQIGTKVNRMYSVEIILRRTLPDQPTKHAQSPYG